MTGRIIQLPGDRHREIQSLLPWYANGALNPSETAQVKAHLSECAECQAELRGEQQLAAAIADLPARAAALDVEHGWNLMRRQIEQQSQGRASFRAGIAKLLSRSRAALAPRSAALRLVRTAPDQFRYAPAPRSRTPWLRWAVAGQFCLLLVMGVAIWRTAESTRYHALGAAPASAAANVVVVFGPETPERELREILRSNNARLVDGPTVADAYLLHVPPAGRAAVLARLRARKQVVLAEPIDAGANP